MHTLVRFSRPKDFRLHYPHCDTIAGVSLISPLHTLSSTTPSSVPIEQRLNGSIQTTYVQFFKAGCFFNNGPAKSTFTFVLSAPLPSSAKAKVLQRRHIYRLHFTDRTHPWPTHLGQQLGPMQSTVTFADELWSLDPSGLWINCVLVNT